jgi:hypothetical protein
MPGRFRTVRSQLGLALAIGGAAVGLTGTLGLAIGGTQVPGPQHCLGPGYPPYCVSSATVFQPYIPFWLAVLVALAATLPLVVLLRPTYWREGILAVTASEGALGGLGLLVGYLADQGAVSSAPQVFVLLWVIGPFLTAVGFWYRRPTEAALPVRRTVVDST